jgi:hypothetical protein
MPIQQLQYLIGIPVVAAGASASGVGPGSIRLVVFVKVVDRRAGAYLGRAVGCRRGNRQRQVGWTLH